MRIQDVRSRLLERARALGLDGDDEETLLDALLEREVAVAEPTGEDCRRYYDAHPESFRSGERIEADHVLFAVTAQVPLDALRRHAQGVLEALLAAPERFAALAAENSNCPSARSGGSLGSLTRGAVVPEFWQAIAPSETIGVLPGLVETRYGLHVVRVSRRERGRMLPFDAVQAQIRAHLAERALRRALRDYAHALMHDGEGAHPH